MKIAFSLFHYFPYGGLQRVFMQIARHSLSKGHQVDVYTQSFSGEQPVGMTVHIIPKQGFTNHGQSRHYAKQLQQRLQNTDYACVIGFNRVPGLDIYYAADVCYQHMITSQRSPWYRLLPRYRTYARMEADIFDKASKRPELLYISAAQRQQYEHYYGDTGNHAHLLPPIISSQLQHLKHYDKCRRRIRRALNLSSQQWLLLMVGSGFKTKGVDRSLRAIAALPEALRQKVQLLIVGAGDASKFIALGRRLGIEERVGFIGPRNDVPELMQAADLLLQPSYRDAAGNVILEALACHLPVLASAACGHAVHIKAADAGLVIPDPFQQETFNRQLQYLLTKDHHQTRCDNARRYIQQHDFTRLPQQVLDIIEEVGNRKKQQTGQQKQITSDYPRNEVLIHASH